ncbi:MAG: leucine-rich repeat domain-containing protein, partial [Synergistaceae bacterium]|nr:leucine-rich repeat domain-containing protein [Synergistaceae bacterium]
ATYEYHVGRNKTMTVNMTILPPDLPSKPTINTTILPKGTVNTLYQTTKLTASAENVTWNVTGLPAGLEYDNNGTISGTPTQAGTFTVTVTATNIAGSVNKTFTLVIDGNGGGDTPTGLSIEGSGVFPDSALRSYLSDNFDTDGDDVLSAEEIAAVTEMDVSGKGITTLDGIENFTALKKLDCSNNSLTTLDVSGCGELTYLDCSDNQLEELNVSGCSKLEYLDCSTNVLPALDVSDCVKLELLDCMDNELVELDISQCPKLETLDCSNNEITSLDVRDCPDLTSLNCDESTEVLRTEEEETPGADPNQEPEPEAFSILTSILPNGTVSTDYEVTILTASVSGVTWNVNGLPNGLTHRDGIISGIPEESGTFTVTVKATKGEQSKTKTIELVISAKGPSMPEPDPEEEPAPTPTPDGGTGGSGSSGGGTGGGNSGNGDGSGTPDQEDNASPDETTLPPETTGPNIIEIVRKFLEEHGIAAQVFTFSDENAVLDSDRDVSSLEAGEREAIQNDNAVIAAILPEINVKKACVYLFSTVLGADVPVGAILIWYPFPQSQGNVALADEDEGYCVFFDEEGSEITTVPENHHINVAAYFATGVTYAPVIGAVANSAADGGKDAGPIPDTSGKSTSDSGGGCDMGLGLFALVLLPLLAVGRRRK